MATTTPSRDAASARRPRPPVSEPAAASATGAATPAPAPADAGAAQAAAAEGQEALAMDSAFDAWSTRALRDHLAWEIAASAAMLRNAKAWREAQMQAAERAESTQLKAGERLLDARSLDDFAAIQFDLMRAHTEDTLQFGTRMAELVSLGLNQAIEQAAAGWLRNSEAAMSGWSDWMRLQSQLPQHADVAEAEVEHMTNPLGAMAWAQPAQEAMRQATSACLSAYNSWLESAGRWQGGPSAPAA
jgi:hypothetical protein